MTVKAWICSWKSIKFYIFIQINNQLGDKFDDEEMLDWLTDPNVMEVSDQIEKVNRKMFDKMTTLYENVAVIFSKITSPFNVQR